MARLIMAFLAALVLSGCGAPVAVRPIITKLPDKPTAHRGGCVRLTDEQRARCDAGDAGMRDICRRAEHTGIYCQQLDGWVLRLHQKWPL